VLLYDIGAV